MKTMRPVSIADFKAAIELGGGNPGSEDGSPKGLVQHYDSSSDSEDEGEDFPDVASSVAA